MLKSWKAFLGCLNITKRSKLLLPNKEHSFNFISFLLVLINFLIENYPISEKNLSDLDNSPIAMVLCNNLFLFDKSL